MVLLVGAAAFGAARVETADARMLAGEILSIQGGQLVLQAEQQRHSLPLNEVVEVVLVSPAEQHELEDVMAKAGQMAVVTALGDRLAVNEIALQAGRLRVRGTLVGSAQPPVEIVRVLYLPKPAESPQDLEKRYEEMKLPAATGDRLLMMKQGRDVLAVDGVLEAIDPERITFQWRGTPRKAVRSEVLMIRLASVSTKWPASRGALVGRDGSTLHFTALGLEKGAFSVDSPAAGKQTIALAKVAAVRFSSDSVVGLAEIKPAAVKEYGYFETTFHYRADRAVSGKPIRLGGRTYRTGLGLHSYCELLYPLGKQYSAFVATVGIDDDVRPNGDATITFLGDGRPLAKPLRLTGKTPPQPVRLKLEGVASFVIRVDFGDDGLGVADHVDLAGARLLK